MTIFGPSYVPGLVDLTGPALQGLVDNGWWQTNAQSNAVDRASELRIWTELVTTTTPGDLRGFCTLFIGGSVDGGVTFEGGLTGLEGPYNPVGDEWKLLDWVNFLNVRADEGVARTFRDESPWPETLPEHYALVLRNDSGEDLADGGNSMKLKKIQLTDGS